MARKKRGRKVARLPAVIASACSTVDQIAMSVVAPMSVSHTPCTTYTELTQKVRRIEVLNIGQARDDGSTCTFRFVSLDRVEMQYQSVLTRIPSLSTELKQFWFDASAANATLGIQE